MHPKLFAFGTPTKAPRSAAITTKVLTLEEEDADATLNESWEAPELIDAIPKPRPFLPRRGPSSQKLAFPSPSTQYRTHISVLSDELHQSHQRCEALELNLHAASSARKLAEGERNIYKEQCDRLSKDNCQLLEENQHLRSKLISLRKDVQAAGWNLINHGNDIVDIIDK
ncbi:hypothetical protein C8J55DRAFT_510167 [Lentinula edodes]|uniref:Uncharacterized protein n=1 Tax=Lentinula lateritia TaxID=40482 RepID=A0A9W8ZUW2_9AGAR|nr:hypothetical protein C8J55DRAFT_525477 [Lentinula edodes]KAJ4484268.1 hypothetical protein C8J55DRAFT_510167 [Lentinula edodes]